MNNEVDNQEYPKICRICLDPNSDEELISPCGCDGPNKWVHRSCINAYRIFCNDPVAFGKCLQCGVDYTFKHVVEHSVSCLITKFIFKLIFQILFLFIAICLFVFVSGLIPYTIDNYSTHYFLSENDSTCHFFSDPYFFVRDMVLGLGLDCFVLGLWSICGMISRCLCGEHKDTDDDELSHTDAQRLGACCSLSLCCMPFIYKRSILSRYGCCYGCFMFPNTCPNCHDCLGCGLATCMCCDWCADCCYVSPYHRSIHNDNCCALSIYLCAEGCRGCADTCNACDACLKCDCGNSYNSCGNCNNCDCSGCGGDCKGGSSGSGIGLIGIIILVIIGIIVCIGAIVGVIALVVLLCYLIRLNYSYIKRQAESEVYIIDNWDESIHPMPTRNPPAPVYYNQQPTYEAPIINPQTINMSVFNQQPAEQAPLLGVDINTTSASIPPPSNQYY
ncbi:hypothetical protein ENUP19_0046G0051 [Entamoeba nuttalli]|uniref:Zinc finger domain containing protein n=2 Tax=Entamoeba nuttalli TaxID=412467 RepID=K2HU87_ENTNP|nr:zinc finger domain containing protein [Entamoeba nuttalli P19]EKE39745.1 zinc finger domain containing protein [Entamoeba nuttalli P19]|eukprot:XP_008857922.1 zinc finger domain containing protein [Entamoeba nuttalli P19]